MAVAVLATLGGVGLVTGDAQGIRGLQGLGLRVPDPPHGAWIGEPPTAGGSSDSETTPTAPGLPATVQSVSFTKQLLSYPVKDATGAQVGTTTWRVVKGTGNCCENHLGITKNGRLIDFGGTYLVFSDDQGLTWKRVSAAEPFVGGEGTVAITPGGDIVGIAWDVYSGDRVIAFKMDAATGSWQYMYNALHTPFYDREWIAVIPGPHTLAGQTVPYITVLRGGWPAKDIWYYSLDGLTYSIASNKVLTQLAGGQGVSEWLPSTPDAHADWTQPISAAGVVPLNGGGALARRTDVLDSLSGARWWVVKPGSLLWTRFRLFDGSELPDGRLVMDSRGWVHLVDAQGGTVSYRLSQDGGRTWTSATTTLPADHTVEDWDLRANGTLGVTSVAIHAHKEASNTDQDLVLRYATTCGQPELTRLYYLGDGNLNAGSSLGPSIRYDFATTVILPDGRIATSLLDGAHPSPAVAIEVGTTFTDPAYQPSLLSCGVPAP